LNPIQATVVRLSGFDGAFVSCVSVIGAFLYILR
jgi:hypothetical protein